MLFSEFPHSPLKCISRVSCHSFAVLFVTRFFRKESLTVTALGRSRSFNSSVFTRIPSSWNWSFFDTLPGNSWCPPLTRCMLVEYVCTGMYWQTDRRTGRQPAWAVHAQWVILVLPHLRKFLHFIGVYEITQYNDFRLPITVIWNMHVVSLSVKFDHPNTIEVEKIRPHLRYEVLIFLIGSAGLTVRCVQSKLVISCSVECSSSNISSYPLLFSLSVWHSVQDYSFPLARRTSSRWKSTIFTSFLHMSRNFYIWSFPENHLVRAYISLKSEHRRINDSTRCFREVLNRFNVICDGSSYLDYHWFENMTRLDYRPARFVWHLRLISIRLYHLYFSIRIKFEAKIHCLIFESLPYV